MMPITEHHVQPLQPGGAVRVEVEHTDYCAIQYEFYIPGAIWGHPAVVNFINELQSVIPGATIFPGMTGVWQRETEITHIYRMIAPAARFSRENVRGILWNRVGNLYAQLSTWHVSAQQAIMFTETEIHVSMSQRRGAGTQPPPTPPAV